MRKSANCNHQIKPIEIFISYKTLEMEPGVALNKDALLLYLRLLGPKIYIFGNTIPVRQVSDFLTKESIPHSPPKRTPPVDWQPETDRYLIVCSRSLIPQFSVEYEHSVIRLIEAEAAVGVFLEQKATLLYSRLHSLVLANKKIYIVTRPQFRTQNENIIFANGGNITKSIADCDMVVVNGKTNDSEETLALMQRQIGGAVVFKGLKWIVKLENFKSKVPNNFRLVNQVDADIFEPYSIYVPQKNCIDDNLIRRGIHLGLKLAELPSDGCITIYDKSKEISRNVRDQVSMCDSVVLRKQWLHQSITSKKIAKVTEFLCGSIKQSRLAERLSMANVRAKVLPSSQYDKCDLEKSIKVLAGRIVESKINALVCSDVISRQDIGDDTVPSELQLVTYRCMTKFITENLPHNCTMRCYPYVKCPERSFKINGEERPVVLYAPALDMEYLGNVVKGLGGVVIDKKSRRQKTLYFASKKSITEDQLADLLKNGCKVYSLKFFRDLVVKEQEPKLEDYSVTESFVQDSQASLESIPLFHETRHAPNLIQMCDNLTPPVPVPVIVLQQTSPVASTSKQVILKTRTTNSVHPTPQPISPVSRLEYDENDKSVFVDNITRSFNTMGLTAGQFSCTYKYNKTISIDITGTISNLNLENDTGRWIMHETVSMQGDIWRFDEDLAITAIYKLEEAKNLDQFVGKLESALKGLGIAVEVAIELRDSSMNKYAIYATTDEINVLRVGVVEMINTETRHCLIRFYSSVFDGAGRRIKKSVRVPLLCEECADGRNCYTGILRLILKDKKCTNCGNNKAVKIPVKLRLQKSNEDARQEQEFNRNDYKEKDFSGVIQDCFEFLIGRDNDARPIDIRKYVECKLTDDFHEINGTTVFYHNTLKHLIMVENINTVSNKEFKLCSKCFTGFKMPSKEKFCKKCSK